MRNILISFVMVVVMLFSAVTSAEESVPSYEGLYLGVKTGNLNSAVTNIDLESAKGFLLGWEFDNGFALEYERNKAEVELDFWGRTVSGDFKSAALYAAYRAYNNNGVFLKFKAGYLSEDMTAKFNSESIVGDESGLSFGVGVGFRGEHISVETEFTMIEEDTDFISIGVNGHF